MNKELEKIPGVIWNFSQPIADNMEEAVSGVKGELAVKLYGTDLRTLESTAQEIINVMRGIPGVRGSGSVPRDRAAQPEFHGGSRQSRPLPDQRRGRAGRDSNRGGRQRAHPGSCRASSATTWCCAIFRSTAIRKRRSRTFGCCRPAESASRWRSSPRSRLVDGASEIYREGQPALCRHQIWRARPRPRQHRRRGDPEGDCAGQAARTVTPSTGPASMPASSAPSAG